MPNMSSIAISLLTALLLGSGALHSCSSSKQQRVISGQERQIVELNAERTALAQSLHIFEVVRSVESVVIDNAVQAQEQAAAKAHYIERQLKEAMRHEKAIDFTTVLAPDVSHAFCLRWLEAAGYASADYSYAGNTTATTGNSSATERRPKLASATQNAKAQLNIKPDNHVSQAKNTQLGSVNQSAPQARTDMPAQAHLASQSAPKMQSRDDIAGGHPCQSWQGLTLGDVFEWTGALLDHAGLDRHDKKAAAEWSRRIQLELTQ